MKKIFTYIVLSLAIAFFLTPATIDITQGKIHEKIVSADDKGGQVPTPHNPEEKALFAAWEEFTNAVIALDFPKAQSLVPKIEAAQKAFEATPYYKNLAANGGVTDHVTAQTGSGSGGCTINSAYWKPSGNQANWYKNYDGQPEMQIIVKTTHCRNQVLTLTVYEADTCGIANCDDALESSGLLRTEFVVPQNSDNFTLRMKAGEEECESGFTGAVFGRDCDLFFYIRQANTVLFNSWSKDAGQLLYDCDTLCRSNAAWIGLQDNGTNENPIDVGSQSETGTFKEDYNLLAPIGGLSTIKTTGSCPTDKDLPNGVGCYLNMIFLLAIGLCAALAVIMIIISSVQYMGDESVFGKTEAKSKILSAIAGLLIALGAYAILNTVSPELTGKNGLTVDQVSILVTPGEDGLLATSESSTTLSDGSVRQKVTLKLKNGGVVPVMSCDATGQVQVNAFGTTFTVQKNLLPSIQRIDAKWRQLNPAYKIPMTTQDKGAMGAYVCRNARGKGKLSWHAYGLAIDINPSTNPAGKVLKSDMPQAFKQLWADEGWGWGGNWSSQKDAMHFSKGTNEGGNMTGE